MNIKKIIDIDESCWKGYKQIGMKSKGGNRVPNCVPESVTEIEEDLRKWFGKGKTGGWDRYNTKGEKIGKCGDGEQGSAYAACLSNEKSAKLGPKGRASFVKRKRAAQKNAGDSKKGGEQSKGQKPTLVKTKANEMKQTLEEKLNLFLEKNIPTDTEKWLYAKSQAKKKFDVYPSAYANGWAAKKYKELGGSWKKDESVNENVSAKKDRSGTETENLIVKMDGKEYEVAFSVDGWKNAYGIAFPNEDNYRMLNKDKKAKDVWARMKPMVDKYLKTKTEVKESMIGESDCGCGDKQSVNSLSLKEFILNEGDYKFGEVEYTAKNMTPTAIQDLAFAYHQAPIGKLAGRSIDHRIRTARDLGRLVGRTPMNPSEKSNQPALLLYLHKNKLVNVEEYKELYNGLIDKLKKVSKYVKNADPSSRKDAAVAKMAARADMREAKKYSIGSGYLGNGLTIWNREEEEFGDYKTIAHISKNGDLKIYDKQLPNDIKKMIQMWADSLKKGNRPELY